MLDVMIYTVANFDSDFMKSKASCFFSKFVDDERFFEVATRLCTCERRVIDVENYSNTRTPTHTVQDKRKL